MTTLFEDGQRLGIGASRERIQQVAGGLAPADLRRVNAVADREHDLVRGSNAPRLVRRQRARIGQALVRRADIREALNVLGGTDDRGDRAMTFGRPADVGDDDAIRSRGHQLEVRLDVGSGGDLTIGAHAEPEVRLRRRHLGGEPRRGDECLREDQRDDEQADHPTVISRTWR